MVVVFTERYIYQALAVLVHLSIQSWWRWYIYPVVAVVICISAHYQLFLW
jgi:hypothetical protein